MCGIRGGCRDAFETLTRKRKHPPQRALPLEMFLAWRGFGCVGEGVGGLIQARQTAHRILADWSNLRRKPARVC